MNVRLISIVATVLIGVAGCGSGSGGGGGQPPPPPPPPITMAEAHQFLNQATFGATQAEADRVIAMRYEAWIIDQLQKPASLQLPHVQSIPIPEFIGQLQQDRVDIWFRNALHGCTVRDHGRVAARRSQQPAVLARELLRHACSQCIR